MSADVDYHTEYLRLAHQTRRLMHFAEAVNENVMGNGLVYRRDALRHVIGETERVLSRTSDSECSPAPVPVEEQQQ